MQDAEWHRGRRYLVFGGDGYVGRRVAAALRALGAEVAASDLRGGGPLAGDLRVPGHAARCVSAAQAQCVVHLASFGMSGREMADAATTWAVNEAGTRHVAAACAAAGAQLVYVSTVNVCFAGAEIVDGDERMPHAAAAAHTDAYSASKAAAERIALETVPNCVALRPYGIYGEGEERHFPRMIGLFKWGLFTRIGHPDDLSDWVHVDNLVAAILQAHARMDRVRGSAYFIGDGLPVNTIDLCEPLWRFVAGHDAPLGPWIPYWLVYRVAHICELLRIPLLSRTEVNKVARTHYWQQERARRELGYVPVVSRAEGLRRMYSHFQAQLVAEGYPLRYQRWRSRIMLAFLTAMCFLFLLVTRF